MGDKHQLINKSNLQNRAYFQGLIGNNNSKTENTYQSVKLKPLVIPKENAGNSTVSPERKFFIRSITNNQPTSENKKKIQSKIPVLQKAFPSRKGKCGNSQLDTLSAADRRQKFHQSRLHVAPPNSSNDLFGRIPSEKDGKIKDFFSWQPEIHLNELTSHIFYANSKGVLPPIQNMNPPQSNASNSIQVKKKCLIGEITHFPALCNLGNVKHIKKSCFSQVPHLPPLFSTPSAPPNSKALSLEQDSSKVT